MKELSQQPTVISMHVMVYEMGAFQNRLMCLMKIKQETLYQHLMQKFNKRGIELENLEIYHIQTWTR